MNDIKNIVDQIVEGLKKQGVEVESVGVFPLGNPNINKGFPNISKESPQNQEAMKEIFNKILAKAKENIAEREKAQADSQNQNKESLEDCYCSECLNYKTFEQVLGKKNGKFDYNELSIGGRIFDVKFWTDGNQEHLVMEPREEHEEKETLESRLENLNKLLNEAIANKDFAVAQLILNDIFKLKNQKQN